MKKYEDVPYFDEARLTLICKKLYAQELKEECFIEKDIIDEGNPERNPLCRIKESAQLTRSLSAPKGT
ncbi:hypothetical protein [Cellulosilyticum sp. WCF-2]|uniref:hypothetical protein n=1 Tax=Cellulosilyticum sp. WCF-2 TaxID=2497860 RepID=UPI001FAAE4C8|nr:hypothetical protein [Cellulosilyticum sp. WCF-2]